MTVMIRPVGTVFGVSWALLAGIDSDHPHTVHQFFCFNDALKEAIELLKTAENEPMPSDDLFTKRAKLKGTKKTPKGPSL